MTLTPSAEQQHVGLYLLGTYELELHDWVEECLRGSYQQVVNIGSSFGYYCGRSNHHSEVRDVSGLDAAQLERLSQEVRGPQTWIYLRPR